MGASIVGAVAASLGGGVAGYQAAFSGLVVVAVLILLTAISLNSREVEQADSAAA